MCEATLLFVLAVAAGSDENLYISIIGFAGAALGAVALIYTSRYKQKRDAPSAVPYGLTQAGTEAFQQNSRRIDQVDERIDRLERRVDINTGRIDRLFDHDPVRRDDRNDEDR